MASLGDFVRVADRKIIANTLSQLKLELDFDSVAISQLQVVLFGFQDAVSLFSASRSDVKCSEKFVEQAELLSRLFQFIFSWRTIRFKEKRGKNTLLDFVEQLAVNCVRLCSRLPCDPV